MHNLENKVNRIENQVDRLVSITLDIPKTVRQIKAKISSLEESAGKVLNKIDKCIAELA